MIEIYQEFWRNIFTWNATATRAQYWWPVLINAVVLFLVSAATGQVNQLKSILLSQGTVLANNISTGSVVFSIFMLLYYVATFTITARRLHDVNRSNWWIILEFIPVVGYIVILIFMVLPSNPNSRWTTNQSEF